MEYLKKIYEQLRDLFLSMTPGNRIIASLLLLTLLVSLGYLIVGSVQTTDDRSKYTYLYDGRQFTSEEKRAVEDVLGNAGMKAHEWIGDQLRVPKNVASSYAATIFTGKAIGDRGSARLLNTALNLGVWEGAKMQDTKMGEARAITLADEITGFPEIASASVVHNKRIEWDKNVWARKTIPSVSVFVDTLHFKPLSDNTISSIGQAVAQAYGITNMRDISIVDRKNSRTYNGNGEEAGGVGGGNYFKTQKQYQEEWKDKIYTLLPYIQGLQVETTVSLKEYFNENIFEVEHVKPKAPIHEHTRDTDYLNEGIGRWGRIGQVAQMSRPLIDSTGGADKAKITEKTSEKEITNPLAGKETRYEILPLTPRRITASLRIPREHVRATWLERHGKQGETPTEPTEEELAAEESRIKEDIRETVGILLRDFRDPKSPDPFDMVNVSFYDPIRPPEVVLSTWQKIQVWLGANWQNLSLMGVVLCGLCVLWSITKPTKPDPIVIYEAPEIPLEVFEAHAQAKAEAEAAEATEDEEDIQRTLEGFDRSIRSLQEEIAELVEENPEAAAAVLRQWIGNIVPVENK